MISRVKLRHRYRSMFYALKKRTHERGEAGVCASDSVVIYVPVKIRIGREEERNLLFKTVNRMYTTAKKNMNICFNFTHTQKVYSHGMLYFFAEINNLHNMYPTLKLSCIVSHTAKVNHVFLQIGLFELCNHRFKQKKFYEDVVHWRSSSGINVIGKNFDIIIDPDYELPELPDYIDIFGACVEATKNAHIHAYIADRTLSKVAWQTTSWWIFSQIKDNMITIAICDLGVGIPGTLPITNQGIFEKVKKFIKGTLDADLIKEAIETPRSRTGKGYRGNGLKRIAEIAMLDKGRHCLFIRDVDIWKLPRVKPEYLILDNYFLAH